jgi:hypothetical protein
LKRKQNLNLKIIIETSTLVSASICWKYKYQNKELAIKESTFAKSCALIEFCKENNFSDDVVITKTVEDEARNALKKAVKKTTREKAESSLVKQYGLMVLQHLVFNDALDRLDYYVEECSTRVGVIRKIRDVVKTQEIEPFIKKNIVNTSRYIQPFVPRFLGKGLSNQLITRIAQSLPRKAVIYKGMPEDKDLVIMAEATLLFRKYESKFKVYVASLDNHFKPNPVLVAYVGGSKRYLGKVDSTIRDLLANEFGFIGEDPRQVLYLVTQELVKPK